MMNDLSETPSTTGACSRLRDRPGDLVLVFFFAIFAFTLLSTTSPLLICSSINRSAAIKLRRVVLVTCRPALRVPEENRPRPDP